MFGKTKTKDLTPHEVDALLKKGEIVLIDVREPAEFAAGRIHGALNFPLSTFDPKALPLPDAAKKVVLQCGSGKRSANAIEMCRRAGVDVDSHLGGGIMAWRAAGLPTTVFDPTSGAVRDAG
ncbi:rhodanese-like domain-containing protein [Phenylobacterium soli]|uniref:Rhodanese-like domain-containing protein n=1 Tax=Phenylobacterium soli TaxID=2170551 RepID=A0A328ALU9_9CAUL|nr:rhodanese-like domain-containing protein [Phenylobacterium soli]RAK55912.1 rhodanese-like domain-containing protein [Phenylobacterium soli]